MLGGLFSPSFGSKCKSLLRVTKIRVELLQKKRKGTEKILKKDIADLLANHLELDAFKRAEGLLAELTVSSGYEFIEDSCNWLLRHVSIMGRRKQCPDNCKEAVASLMFAAAWFSDLPELRDLRDLFYNRYSKNMESYVNQKFAASLTTKRYSTEKKVRLMEDIATELSVKWNSEPFKQRIFGDLVPVTVRDKVTIQGLLTDKERRKSSFRTQDLSSRGQRLFRRAHDQPSKQHRPSHGKEKAIMSRVNWYLTLHQEKTKVDARHHQPREKPAKQEQDTNFRDKVRPKKQVHYLLGYSSFNVHHSDGKLQQVDPIRHGRQRADRPLEEKVQQIKSQVPTQRCRSRLRNDPLPDARKEKVQERIKVPGSVGNRNKNRHKELRELNEMQVNEGKHNQKLNNEIVVKKKFRNEKNSGVRTRTLELAFQEDSQEEEEEMLDKLLLEYSTKRRRNPESFGTELNGLPSNQISLRAGNDNKLAMIPVMTRSKSLPQEQSAPTETGRELVRISSCQEKRLAPHVHPKLPDYDELAAKFAALKQQRGS